MSFLQLDGKTFFITGIANKKSIAYHCAKIILEQGAKIILSAQTPEHKKTIEKLLPGNPVIMMDVENKEHLNNLAQQITQHTNSLDGFIHSMAFANFNQETPHFYQTTREDFFQATQISCFSLVEISKMLKNILTKTASVVTISISSTKATSYGYLGPIKAALESSVAYLAKSFSSFSQVRFNAVGAGPLKTSASAGIPNYIENYLYAESLTLRKQALKTQEVANTVAFLLSPRSSGINAITLRVDAGMEVNYFDENIVTSYAQQQLES